jgi:hypothetical protein
MIPVRGQILLTSVTPHPHVLDWLAQRLGVPFTVQVELPSRLELCMRDLGADLDPEEALITSLAGRGVLRSEELPNIQAMRTLITDPVPQWLLMQQMATEEELHQAFLDISYLPFAGPWRPEEIRRLLPVLPPGFAVENQCFGLDYQNGLRLGLAQVPPARVLNEIYTRLTGYPVCFQALSLEDFRSIQRLL